MSALKSVTPERAVEMIRDGAVLIDVREANEHVRENIPGARHHALSRIDAQDPAREGDQILIFHCKSGGRTRMHGARLSAATDCEAFVLEGGIDAWKRAGLPVASNAPARPWWKFG